MKKTLILLLLSAVGTQLFAQTIDFKYEGDGEVKVKVLFIDGKKFTGKKAEILKFEENPVQQPTSPDLIILSTVESKHTDIWQYFLLQFIDNQWEYITSFPGYKTPPTVTKMNNLHVIQKYEDVGEVKEKKYLIFPMMLTSYPAQRVWNLFEIK